MAAMDNPDIILQRELNVTREAVYRAWTVPSELERWFFTDCEADVRLQGTYRFHWRSRGNPEKDHVRFGTYLEVEAPHLLGFEWDGFRLPFQAKPTTVHVVFEDTDDGGTLLTLTHAGWGEEPEWQEERRSHIAGWSFYLDNLKRYLEGGPDLRFAHYGQLAKVTFP